MKKYNLLLATTALSGVLISSLFAIPVVHAQNAATPPAMPSMPAPVSAEQPATPAAPSVQDALAPATAEEPVKAVDPFPVNAAPKEAATPELPAAIPATTINSVPTPKEPEAPVVIEPKKEAAAVDEKPVAKPKPKKVAKAPKLPKSKPASFTYSPTAQDNTSETEAPVAKAPVAKAISAPESAPAMEATPAMKSPSEEGDKPRARILYKHFEDNSENQEEQPVIAQESNESARATIETPEATDVKVESAPVAKKAIGVPQSMKGKNTAAQSDKTPVNTPAAHKVDEGDEKNIPVESSASLEKEETPASFSEAVNMQASEAPEKNTLDNEKPASVSASRSVIDPVTKDTAEQDEDVINLDTALAGQDAPLVSLHDALVQAYNNNPTIKAEQSSLEAANENLPQAYSGFLPTISANYNVGKEKSTVGKSREEKNDPESRSLSLSQPIFSGGQTVNAIGQAKERIETARARLHQAEQDVLVQSVTAYIDVVRARQVLELSRNNERVLTEQLEATKERFKLGETTRTDVAQSESRLARATSDRINAEGTLVTANAGYKRLFEIDPPAGIQMPESLPSIPASLDEAQSIANENNPNLNAAGSNLQVSKHAVKISQGALLPVVALQGSMTRETGLSPTRQGGTRDEDLVRLNVNVPLYQAGAEYSRVRQAKRELESAEHKLEETQNSTVNNVTRAWKDIETARANIQATQTSVDAAKLALEGVRQEQEIGSRTTLDVLDAEQELFVAQVNLVTAKRNEVVSVYNLLAAIGKLTAKELGLNVKLYDENAHYDSLRFKLFGLD